MDVIDIGEFRFGAPLDGRRDLLRMVEGRDGSAMPSGASKVSGVPQSAQKPRNAEFEELKVFGRAARPVEFCATH